MKQISTLALCLFLVCYGTYAAIILVTVTNNQFSPANITNVQVGDVIRYTFTQGFHNASSVNVSGGVPTGAPDIFSGAPANVNPRTYDYTATVPGAYRYVCEVHGDPASFTGMVGQFTVQAALPVTLKEFSVSALNGKPALVWKTAAELNVDHFEVKSSTDAIKFKTIGKLQAVGTSSTEQVYSFLDNSLPTNRYIYYMLAIVDKDGIEKSTEMKMFKNKASITGLITQMSPNPVTKNQQLMIQFNAESTGQLQASVYDASGRLVMQSRMSAFEGLNNGHLHAGELPKGTYRIVFALNGKKESKTIIVR